MSHMHTRRLMVGASLFLLPVSPLWAQDSSAPPAATLPPVEAVQEDAAPAASSGTVTTPTVASPVAPPAQSSPQVANASTSANVPTTQAELPPAVTNAGPALVPGMPGTLIVVDDAFVPVTIATDYDLLSEGDANIADAIDQRPGITGSTFAPGANRPIIRGLDTYRVRVQENGIGSHDVSALSEDHAVPIDPFAADQVEVIRGPATLRYGSQAIGGVVAVENGRVPSYVPKYGFEGTTQGDLSSVDEGHSAAFKTKAGTRGVVVHADGFKRRTEDYDTPRGRQFNSFVEAEGGALGSSLVGPDGFVGVAISRYMSFYGIPGEEAAELMPRIDLEQDRIQARGEWRAKRNGIEAVRFWFGASDYEHREIVDEGDGDEVGSRFTADVVEGRVEVQHQPFLSRWGKLQGAVGLQVIDRQERGQSFEGDSLLEPADTQSFAAFWFEEVDLTPFLQLQAAARIEHADIDGSGRLDPLNPAVPLVALSRDYTPFGLSLGGLLTLRGGSVVSLNGQYVERAPAAPELFSAGIHEATGTFEIGNPDLDKEKAWTAELGWRNAEGPLRFDTTAFYTRFDGFIFKQLTGLECEEDLASCGNVSPTADETLDQVLFQQRDAHFYGVELAAQYDVGPLWRGVWGVEGQYDFVRARFDVGGDVPRIPPHRLGGGLFYRDGNVLAKAGILHAFDQDRIGENEIATPGYTLVSAEISYTSPRGSDGFGPQFTIGLKGENLADDEVLNHASFKRREDVLLPGASVKLFGKLKFN